MNDACETPMADHVKRFWELLETEFVHIVVNIQRLHDEGQPPHWDSSTFSNEVAKAVVAQRHSQAGNAGNSELARKARLFREGTKRLYESQGDRADMWLFELWHFLGDVEAALQSPPKSAMEVNPSELMGEIERLRRLLNSRDDFIVNKGLWSEFTDSLSREEQRP